MLYGFKKNKCKRAKDLFGKLYQEGPAYFFLLCIIQWICHFSNFVRSITGINYVYREIEGERERQRDIVKNI